MIQIRIRKGKFYKWWATHDFYEYGGGNSIQEAIEDFLKINKLQNVPYSWR